VKEEVQINSLTRKSLHNLLEIIYVHIHILWVIRVGLTRRGHVEHLRANSGGTSISSRVSSPRPLDELLELEKERLMDVGALRLVKWIIQKKGGR
jgi:hypothetical protein